MKTFLTLAALLLISNAYATETETGLGGQYRLVNQEINAGDVKYYRCSEIVDVKVIKRENKDILVELNSGTDHPIAHYSNNINFKVWGEDGGSIGYHREGGIVSKNRATSISTIAGPVLMLFGFPVFARKGSTIQLSDEGKTLTFERFERLLLTKEVDVTCKYERID